MPRYIGSLHFLADFHRPLADWEEAESGFLSIPQGTREIVHLVNRWTVVRPFDRELALSPMTVATTMMTEEQAGRLRAADAIEFVQKELEIVVAIHPISSALLTAAGHST